jgi:hypothetical protein
MKVSQKLYNEKLRSSSGRLWRLIASLVLIFLGLQLAGLFSPRKFGDGSIAMFFFGLLAVYLFVAETREKMLIWINFDYQAQVVEIATVTLFSREKIQQIPIANVRYKTGKEGRSFMPYIEMFNGEQRVVHLTRDGIGANTFQLIDQELTQLGN